jgi:hypothetical protein
VVPLKDDFEVKIRQFTKESDFAILNVDKNGYKLAFTCDSMLRVHIPKLRITAPLSGTIQSEICGCDTRVHCRNEFQTQLV